MIPIHTPTTASTDKATKAGATTATATTTATTTATATATRESLSSSSATTTFPPPPPPPSLDARATKGGASIQSPTKNREVSRSVRNHDDGNGNNNNNNTATIATAAAATATPNDNNNDDDNDNNENENNNSRCNGQIRVISFDLDNTLWGTTPTIEAALKAVSTFLESHGIPPPPPPPSSSSSSSSSSSRGGGGDVGTTNTITAARTTEMVMKELWQGNRAAYAPLLSDRASCPVMLTKLRNDAVQHLLVHDHGYSVDDATELSQRAFRVMSDARHAAIPDHLAVGAVECLSRLRNGLRCHCDDDENGENDGRAAVVVVMGAITDGNAHPGRVEALRPFFDFVIQAETVGVGKPHARIFREAVRRVWPDRVIDDDDDDDDDMAMSTTTTTTTTTTATTTAKRNGLHEWVHIGDDLQKDIVGAKAVGMRTIWCREFIQDKVKRRRNNNNNNDDDNRDVIATPTTTARNTTTTMATDLSSWNTTTTATTTTTSSSSSSCQETKTMTDSDSNNRITKNAATDDEDDDDDDDEACADAIVDRFMDIVDVLEAWHNHGGRTR